MRIESGSSDAKRSVIFAAGLAFASAALLFSVQPYFGKKLLPSVGGGPAVWNACLVFFQSALVAGYLYAAELNRSKRGGLIHACFLVAASVWLFAVPAQSFEAVGGSPTLATLLTLTVSAGLPVAALCATTPLLHHWGGGYRIYAASNAGSLAALVFYPFVVEPNLGLASQWNYSRWAYVAFAAALTFFALRRPWTSTGTAADAAAPTFRWSWLFWPALPSALLVSTTQTITEDVAAGPLLWLPPLVLFLVASILAFAGFPLPIRWISRLLAPMLLIRSALLAVAAVSPSLAVPSAVELATLLLASWSAFSILFSQRPSETNAGGFYVALAVGGAAGGAVVSLGAPHVFHSLAEHPLALLLLVLFAPVASGSRRNFRLEGAVVILAAIVILSSREAGREAASLESMLLFGSIGMTAAFAVERRLPYALAIGIPLALLASSFASTSGNRPLAAERSEFGVHRVMQVRDGDHEGDLHALRHGGVNHGWQNRTPGKSAEALGYYHPQSAVGEALAWRNNNSNGDVAVIGLGAGAALVHRNPAQRFVFFEIDPAVVRIAKNPALFSYLDEAGERAEIRLGDGRLRLSQETDGTFETIFLDAFSGDAVPTHLLTREAFATYQRKLKPDGVVIVNITNWFVDLEAVVARSGELNGLNCVGKDQTGGRLESGLRPAPTRCLVLSMDERLLGDLVRREGWERKRTSPKPPLWTDDFGDVWSVIRWR